MKTHFINILPEYFDRLIRREKPFELIENDRDYREGDYVVFHECTFREGTVGTRVVYSGRSCAVVIRDVYPVEKLYPQFAGFVIFTFALLRVDA